MAREIIIETGHFGEGVFYKKRRGHHHHRHHHHEQWPSWEEIERLKANNDALLRERDCLRADLDKANATLTRQDAEERRLVGENHRLRREIEVLRKANGGWDDETHRLRNRLVRAGNEIEDLKTRNRALEDRLAQAEAANRCKHEHLLSRLRSEIAHLRDKLAYYETAPCEPRRRWW